METNLIELADMAEWLEFAVDNEDALIDECGSVDAAYRRAVDGALMLGGGAAPLFEIRFAE